MCVIETKQNFKIFILPNRVLNKHGSQKAICFGSQTVLSESHIVDWGKKFERFLKIVNSTPCTEFFVVKLANIFHLFVASYAKLKVWYALMCINRQTSTYILQINFLHSNST